MQPGRTVRDPLKCKVNLVSDKGGPPSSVGSTLRQFHLLPPNSHQTSPSASKTSSSLPLSLSHSARLTIRMTLLDSLTSTPVILAGLLGISVAVYAKRNASPQVKEQVKEVKNATRAEGVAGKMAQAVSKGARVCARRRCLSTSPRLS
jgi:hypothetical protein